MVVMFTQSDLNVCWGLDVIYRRMLRWDISALELPADYDKFGLYLWYTIAHIVVRLYSQTAITWICGDYFNNSESPKMQITFAFCVIMSCLNSPKNKDMSWKRQQNLISSQLMFLNDQTYNLSLSELSKYYCTSFLENLLLPFGFLDDWYKCLVFYLGVFFFKEFQFQIVTW